MIKSLTNQTIALAGLLQATRLVQIIAKSGTLDSEAAEPSIASVLRINAEDVESVYGGLDKLQSGLKLVENQLGAPEKIDPELARYAASLILLESKLRGRPDLQAQIRTGVEKASAQAAHFGTVHENVLANLADLYQATISQLRPRVMVMGEPAHLTNPGNANRIRSLLLSGIRSAVLWRQCGGSRWRFLFGRGAIQEKARQLLASA
jgi:high frequency lysogenization protein